MKDESTTCFDLKLSPLKTAKLNNAKNSEMLSSMNMKHQKRSARYCCRNFFPRFQGRLSTGGVDCFLHKL